MTDLDWLGIATFILLGWGWYFYDANSKPSIPKKEPTVYPSELSKDEQIVIRSSLNESEYKIELAEKEQERLENEKRQQEVEDLFGLKEERIKNQIKMNNSFS